MSKDSLVDYIKSVLNGNHENARILKAIDETKLEIEAAKSVFDSVDDPLLIEAAIYAEEAARKRYSHLMTLAKQRGITVNRNYILSKNIKFAE
ncbi:MULTISPECIES: DUF2508 family protein [Clostridium]|uniref:DUF2508 family protein n=2 Tax=Clostridium TaxID=1485 RepID=A0A0A7FYI3_9CLOT|nr:DUF2508 family protein [Clostridium baratii]AIY83866.1 hypothetical protein U729_936 [Clostridium baratii str. Sullivan]AQM59532.1 hypothetical protein NPD11_2056 [Clostridium baratii]KJU72552.1 hypothetical protein UC77_03830 [Clostridium baratii]MBS6008035.1 DUF2508 family protein [Clostridium baratii]MBS6043146.1 DUF2508 family protein [Clostridium baratii]